MIDLTGTYECKADAKGRVMLPVALKKQLQKNLDEGFVIKRSVFSQCLEIHPMNEWHKVVFEINKLNRFVKKNNDFIRMFTAGVKLISLDVTGRLLVPKDLQIYAGIEKQIVLSSSANMIEIWDKRQYELIINNEAVDFAKLAEDVMGDNTLEDA